MELIDGVEIARWLPRRKSALDQLLRVFGSLFEGLTSFFTAGSE